MIPSTSERFEFAGRTWEVEKLDLDEQFEVECIMMRVLGPAAAAALAALVQGVAPALVDVLRETAGEGEKFDLARLADLDTADPRISFAWEKFLDAAAETGGDIVRDGVSSLAERIDHRSILRLFTLVILSKTKVFNDGGTDSMQVTDYRFLSTLLSRDPSSKWSLLARGLSVTYTDGSGKPKEDA